MSQVINLSVDILKVHPQNTEFFDDIEGEAYERFKKSIKEDGIITPIIVTPDMTIISGHQRYKASKDLGIKLVPSIIREDLEDKDEQLKKLLATNFGRMKNNPVKQGRVYEQYEKLCGIERGNNQHSLPKNSASMTQQDIANELGVSVDTIQNLKKLQTLSPELQQLIEDGQVKYTTALNVWGKLSNEEQAKFIGDMGKEHISNLTAKETQEILDKYKQLEEEKKQVERVAWQAEQALKEVIEENEQLKNRPPETVKVKEEVIPEDYEMIKARLKALQEEESELGEFSSRRKQVEREIEQLKKEKFEQEKLYMEIETMTKMAEQEQSLTTLRKRFTRDVLRATDQLKSYKTKLEHLYKETGSIGDNARQVLEVESKFLYEMAELFKEMAKIDDYVDVDDYELIQIEGEIVND